LLKELQSKEIESTGGVETIQLNLRFIATTNRNLEKMIQDGDYRENF